LQLPFQDIRQACYIKNKPCSKDNGVAQGLFILPVVRFFIYLRFMKRFIALHLLVLSLSLAGHSQDNTPQLLKEPASWTFERFSLPPSFAPAFPFTGAEELRFSPGMFHKDSVTYFTYVFVAELDNTVSVSKKDVHTYVLNYFKGLCSSVAKDRKLTIDTSVIKADVEQKKGTTDFYNANLNIFGVFTDGAPVKLNMEIKVLKNAASKKTYLFFIASPLARTDKTWDELRAIQNGFAIPVTP